MVKKLSWIVLISCFGLWSGCCLRPPDNARSQAARTLADVAELVQRNALECRRSADAHSEACMQMEARLGTIRALSQAIAGTAREPEGAEGGDL